MFLQQKSMPDAQALISIVKGSDLFAELSADEIKKLTPALRVKEFKDEDIVCHCPDATHDAFILTEGKAVAKLMVGDLLHVMELQGKGAIFNAPGLLQVRSRYGSASALGKVVLIAVDSKQIQTLISKSPHTGVAILKTACRLTVEQYEKQLQRLLK